MLENTPKYSEIKQEMDDILISLNYENDYFRWNISSNISQAKLPDDKPKWINLKLQFIEDPKYMGTEWVKVLQRLFSLLREYGFKIYDLKESFTEITDKTPIKQTWSVEVLRNPLTFGIDEVVWQKQFSIK